MCIGLCTRQILLGAVVGENKKKLVKWKAGRNENELLMLADVPLMHHG